MFEQTGLKARLCTEKMLEGKGGLEFTCDLCEAKAVLQRLLMVQWRSLNDVKCEIINFINM